MLTDDVGLKRGHDVAHRAACHRRENGRMTVDIPIQRRRQSHDRRRRQAATDRCEGKQALLLRTCPLRSPKFGARSADDILNETGGVEAADVPPLGQRVGHEMGEQWTTLFVDFR